MVYTRFRGCLRPKGANTATQHIRDFRHLTDNVRDIVYHVSLVPKAHLEYINPAVTDITGFTPEEFYKNIKLLIRQVYPGDCHLLRESLRGRFSDRGKLRWKHRNGHVLWLEYFNIPFYDDDGNLIAVQGVARSMFPSYESVNMGAERDMTTGLRGRHCFEEYLLRLDNVKDGPVGLIMVDMDGLKFFNDTFGYKAGNKMLSAAAEVLLKSIRPGDYVFRVGGDEFVIIVNNCSHEVLEEYCREINKSVAAYNTGRDYPMGLSMGMAMREAGSSDFMEQVLKAADENMCRRKLHRCDSRCSSIVNTLMRTMGVRDYATKLHCQRMEGILGCVGEDLGLSIGEVLDLRLLAQFHDIGKVAVPERILEKKGPLTLEERRIMKRHSIAGYLIIKSAPELMHLADWILKHHEWWNGGGYPLGLKGEEIPYQSRLLSIIDAYDAMTNDRPYRRAMTHEDCLAELNKSTGIQFDPELAPVVLNILGRLGGASLQRIC